MMFYFFNQENERKHFLTYPLQELDCIVRLLNFSHINHGCLDNSPQMQYSTAVLQKCCDTPTSNCHISFVVTGWLDRISKTKSRHAVILYNTCMLSERRRLHPLVANNHARKKLVGEGSWTRLFFKRYGISTLCRILLALQVKSL